MGTQSRSIIRQAWWREAQTPCRIDEISRIERSQVALAITSHTLLQKVKEQAVSCGAGSHNVKRHVKTFAESGEGETVWNFIFEGSMQHGKTRGYLGYV